MPLAQILILACGVAALIYGLITSRQVLAHDPGNARMQEIAAAVQEGARAYLNRQYMTIGIVGVVILIILGALLGIHTAIGFIIGAVLSGAAGYIGIECLGPRQLPDRPGAALERPSPPASTWRSRPELITGMLVVGLGLLGVAGYYFVLRAGLAPGADLRPVLEAMVALGFGGSLISIFARLGGGIFTKGADVGADLVGKVEAGIPEDDPRNPAVIADNVGDNVGDCAGMAADLFETYAVTIVATMLLAAIFFTGETRDSLLMLPLGIGGICILTSIAGTYFVKLGADNGIMKALYKGLIVTGVRSIIGVALVISLFVGFSTPLEVTGGGSVTGWSLFVCAVVGLLITGAIVWITASTPPPSIGRCASIAQSSTTGHGTNVIQGLAISMEATALPVIVISMGIIVTFMVAGLFGIAGWQRPPCCHWQG